MKRYGVDVAKPQSKMALSERFETYGSSQAKRDSVA